MLNQTDLIELDPCIRILAQPVRSAAVLSRDVIHLGTARFPALGLTSFVTDGKRLLEAAQAGLPVDWPD